MPLPAAGLRTHIWNNNLLSMVLIGLYPLLIGGVVWACAVAIAFFLQGDGAGAMALDSRILRTGTDMAAAVWPLVFGVVAAWFVISFLFNVRLVAMMAGSKPVTRKEEPELYNLLENLCISRGIPTPSLQIIETHARNAFASGLTRDTYTITVTRGLIQSLTRDEIEAVLGHELTHIINKDVLLLMVCVVFTGMLGFASQMAWRSIRYSGRSRGRKKGGGVAIILALAVILSIGYGLTLLTRFALSRRREYMADGGSVELTHKPEAMISALQRIAGRDRIPDVPADVSLMCIENSQPFFGLFATHPPIDSRIAVLARTSGIPVPDIMSLPPAPSDARFVPHGKTVSNPWKKNKKNPWEAKGE
ncbi:MAG: M48 family metallopeptidase [Rhodospirillales bacterium]|nr:M48 family metallopeptidase [Rhodospirillales bacterium]